MEIQEDSYTRKHGGGRVTASDVLDVDEDNPRATIVADLTRADHVRSSTRELLLVDDGSTDASTEVAARYAEGRTEKCLTWGISATGTVA